MKVSFFELKNLLLKKKIKKVFQVSGCEHYFLYMKRKHKQYFCKLNLTRLFYKDFQAKKLNEKCALESQFVRIEL